jgi:hypothetical protein
VGVGGDPEDSSVGDAANVGVGDDVTVGVAVALAAVSLPASTSGKWARGETGPGVVVTVGVRVGVAVLQGGGKVGMGSICVKVLFSSLLSAISLPESAVAVVEKACVGNHSVTLLLADNPAVIRNERLLFSVTVNAPASAGPMF